MLLSHQMPPNRLGHCMQRAHILGLMDRTLTAVVYQLHRGASATCLTLVSSAASGQAYASPDGQHCNS